MLILDLPAWSAAASLLSTFDTASTLSASCSALSHWLENVALCVHIRQATLTVKNALSAMFVGRRRRSFSLFLDNHLDPVSTFLTFWSQLWIMQMRALAWHILLLVCHLEVKVFVSFDGSCFNSAELSLLTIRNCWGINGVSLACQGHMGRSYLNSARAWAGSFFNVWVGFSFLWPVGPFITLLAWLAQLSLLVVTL